MPEKKVIHDDKLIRKAKKGEVFTNVWLDPHNNIWVRQVKTKSSKDRASKMY